MSDARRFDQLERVVRDTRRQLDDLTSTILARLGTHTHPGGGGGGVTDHGALTGLADDDHPQYVTHTEGNAAYQPLDSDLTTIAGLSPTDGQLMRRVAGAWAAYTLSATDITTGTLPIGQVPTGTSGTTVALGNHTHAAAPPDAAYLVTTADGTLTNEVVVGTSPGGELGGTWAAPTVDATHSGSAHADFVAKATVDAKGDLLAGTANDTVGRLAAGGDGQALYADSAESTGLKWDTPRGWSKFILSGSTAGRRYAAGMTGCSTLTGSIAVNTLRAVPFLCPRSLTADRLAFEVTTAAGAGGVARVGIYTNLSDTSPQPDALLVDGGQFTTTGTGVKEATISQALTGNTLYWFAFVAGTAAPTCRYIDPTALWPIFGADTTLGGSARGMWQSTFTYAALPSTFTAGGAPSGNFAPMVTVRLV